MARSITKNKGEYGVARRNQYQTTRKAIEDADPKLQRQLREIEAQEKQRTGKWFSEIKEGEKTGVENRTLWKEPVSDRKFEFAKSEKERRTKRAKARFWARRKK
tara:strand:- start:262 stop:573 length:312 start_codon:yes stop_codon:yes gene_type:complete